MNENEKVMNENENVDAYNEVTDIASHSVDVEVVPKCGEEVSARNVCSE